MKFIKERRAYLEMTITPKVSFAVGACVVHVHAFWNAAWDQTASQPAPADWKGVDEGNL